MYKLGGTKIGAKARTKVKPQVRVGMRAQKTADIEVGMSLPLVRMLLPLVETFSAGLFLPRG